MQNDVTVTYLNEGET